MKRFVICLDGTWQKLRQTNLTNIGIIARSVAHTHTFEDEAGIKRKIPQIVIYTHGVGSSIEALADKNPLQKISTWFNKLFGGAFGEGLEDGIVDTYLKLAFNYELGDEIYLFGFSRGAFSARSLAGMISSVGIVSRRHAEKAWDAFRLYRNAPPENAPEEKKREHKEELRQFRKLYGKGARDQETGARLQTDDAPTITYLGIFDTVGRRGMPEELGSISRKFNQRYAFHNLHISKNVLRARHAVALDENRLGFPPTLWEGLDEANRGAPQPRYQERWFVGTHGDVGGGQGSPLSAYPLKWIADGAAEAGLRFYATHGADESPLGQALREAGLSFDTTITRPSFWKSLSPMNYPFGQRRIWIKKGAPTEADAKACLDQTVVMRFAAARVQPRYTPASLRPFRPALGKWAKDVLPPDEIRG